MSKVNLKVNVDSNYGKATEFMRKNRIYTRTMLMDFFKGLGKDEKQSSASTGVMLSPRKSSSAGDCRGNASNIWGHLAYNDKLARSIDKETGKKTEQKFRFRYRAEELPRQIRKRKEMTTQEKEVVTAPTTAPTTATTTTTTTTTVTKKAAKEIVTA